MSTQATSEIDDLALKIHLISIAETISRDRGEHLKRPISRFNLRLALSVHQKEVNLLKSLKAENGRGQSESARLWVGVMGTDSVIVFDSSMQIEGQSEIHAYSLIQKTMREFDPNYIREAIKTATGQQRQSAIAEYLFWKNIAGDDYKATAQTRFSLERSRNTSTGSKRAPIAADNLNDPDPQAIEDEGDESPEEHEDLAQEMLDDMDDNAMSEDEGWYDDDSGLDEGDSCADDDTEFDDDE